MSAASKEDYEEMLEEITQLMNHDTLTDDQVLRLDMLVRSLEIAECDAASEVERAPSWQDRFRPEKHASADIQYEALREFLSMIRHWGAQPRESLLAILRAHGLTTHLPHVANHILAQGRSLGLLTFIRTAGWTLSALPRSDIWSRDPASQ